MFLAIIICCRLIVGIYIIHLCPTISFYPCFARKSQNFATHTAVVWLVNQNGNFTLSLRTLIIEVCLNGVTVSLRTLIIEVCLYGESILKLRKCPKHWHTSCMPVLDALQALICSKLNRIIVKQQFILLPRSVTHPAVYFTPRFHFLWVKVNPLMPIIPQKGSQQITNSNQRPQNEEFD